MAPVIATVHMRLWISTQSLKRRRRCLTRAFSTTPSSPPRSPRVSRLAEAAAKVRFEGTDKPSIPISWRFAESISALKGLEAAMTNVLLQRKYGLEPQEAVINTYLVYYLILESSNCVRATLNQTRHTSHIELIPSIKRARPTPRDI
ncbi:hypothetical protein EJ07DRAFT_159778 [Lizonia empirigonia]|nr:hypothetical protein EJ07DRAFT_159759 [Lizonia empirigonia]KAF1349447.1 hypothetical protein EJ07DRAFT_159778 [Lizonia empirigonia]